MIARHPLTAFSRQSRNKRSAEVVKLRHIKIAGGWMR